MAHSSLETYLGAWGCVVDTNSTLLEQPGVPSPPVAKSSDAVISEPESILKQAEHWSAQACFDHAEALWNGTKDFPVDRSEAAVWYEQAAKKGLPGGMFAFAECLRWGDGVLRNPSRAEVLYRMAAEAGDPRAIHWLAHAYAVGDGVQRNQEEAAKWERRTTGASPFQWVWIVLFLISAVVLATLGYRWWLSR